MGGALAHNARAADNALSIPAGFVRVSIPAGQRALLSTPFYPLDDSLDGLFAGQLPCPTNGAGYRLLKWDSARQSYVAAVSVSAADTLTGAGALSWTPQDDSATADLSPWPGEGFWLENRTECDRDVYLCGQLALDETIPLRFLPGANLFANPFCTALDIRQEGPALEPGDTVWGATTNAEWVAVARADETAVLRIGSGYWYWKAGDRQGYWDLRRPYADVFPTGGPPRIARMQARGAEVTLTIACSGAEGESLDVFCQDIACTGRFVSAGPWTLADAGLRPSRVPLTDWSACIAPRDESVTLPEPQPSPAVVRWTDCGIGLRDRLSPGAVDVRVYVIGRGDLDSDGDGLPDARETLLYGTDPRAADSDGDAMPDGWEVQNRLNPLANDAGEDPDSDGRSNLAEYRGGTRPQCAREHAVTFHVDCREGDDRYSGLAERSAGTDGPKRTINAALAAAIPGDTVLVHEGVYDESVDVRGTGIGLQLAGSVELGAGRQER
jgi:hypothetical protein